MFKSGALKIKLYISLFFPGINSGHGFALLVIIFFINTIQPGICISSINFRSYVTILPETYSGSVTPGGMLCVIITLINRNQK